VRNDTAAGAQLVGSAEAMTFLLSPAPVMFPQLHMGRAHGCSLFRRDTRAAAIA